MKCKVYSILLVFVMILSSCGKQADTAISEGTAEESKEGVLVTVTWQEQYDLGIRYLSEGNYKEAIIAFTAAIEIDPKQAVIYIGRGNAYIASGETEETFAFAFADYEKAAELDETNEDAYLGMAEVYICRGEIEKAQEILEVGFKATGSEMIEEKLKEIQSGTIRDRFGRVRREEHYDGNGMLIYCLTYTYDSEGREKVVTSFDGAGNIINSVELMYDENGRNLTRFGINGGILYVIRQTYDENGNVIRWENEWPEEFADSPYGTWFKGRSGVYTYNEEGKVCRQDEYDATGELDLCEVYSYEDGGKTMIVDTYDESGMCRARHISEYDDEGRVIKASNYDENGTLDSYIVVKYNDGTIESYYYDGNGNLTHSSTDVYD